MYYSFKQSAGVFLALLRRELTIFSHEIVATLIDGIVIIITEVILFGGLLPAMGMPIFAVGPLYIGTIIWVLFFLGENLAIRHVFDLKQTRLIDYQITLPISHAWLFAHFVVAFIIEALTISIPLFLLGVWLLGDAFTRTATNWPAFIAVYLLGITFIALFFLYLSFCYSFEWFMDNVWPRILSPMWGFGCVFFLWKQARLLAPLIAYICLLNPLTYISEGLRSSLIGGDQFINAWWCVAALLVFNGLVILGLIHGIRRQLDPV